MVDLGIGIRASLIRNQAYRDVDTDVEAIEAALEPRVTSTPERNAGIGLFVTKLLLSANGGEMLVRSGTGAVYRGSEDRAESRATRLPGTVVALRARTDRPLDINAVYAQLP